MNSSNLKYISIVLIGVIAISLINSQASAVLTTTSISGNGDGTHIISCQPLAGGIIDFHATKQGNKVVGGTISINSPNPFDATSYVIYSGVITDVKSTNKGYVLKGVLDTVTSGQLGGTVSIYPGGICSPLSDSFTISGNYGTNVPISLVTIGNAGTFTGSFSGTVTKS